MRRRILVRTPLNQVTITAEIRTKDLTRCEVERVRDELADRLQAAAAELPYVGVPRNRVTVL